VSKVGIAGIAAIFGAGLWLIAVPFALRFQRAGAGWTGTTRTDVIIGAVLAVAAFIGAFGVLAGRVRELYSDARSAASLASAAEKGNSGP
jgi:hypothetical protein